MDRAPTRTPLDLVRKEDLVDRNGGTYQDFRRQLQPRLGRVWAQLLAGHAALAATAVLAVLLERAWPRGWALIALGAAALVAYCSAYIQLFFHEAAHFNIASSRRWNDLLANLFIGSLVAQDIRDYRVIHFDHHRYLGSERDTERSYFDALDLWFLLESLTGIKAWRVLAARRRVLSSERGRAAAGDRRSRMPALIGLLAHGSVIAAGAWLGSWSLVAGWILGTAVGLPFLIALRQLLEHRAIAGIGRSKPPDSGGPAVTRMFGGGPLPGTFGAAGFNRHLLHHWDPQVSYTRLAELESFLLDTPAAATVRSMRTSYAKAIKDLFER